MQKNRRGSAMVIVMCVMTMAVALSLVLLLTASILIMNADRSRDKEQCRINAVAISDVLSEEIKGMTYDGTEDGMDRSNPESLTKVDYDQHVPPKYNASGKSNTLKGKLKTVATGVWNRYDPNAGTIGNLNSRFNYDLSGCGLPGSTTLQMYWRGDSLADGGLDMNDPMTAAGYFGDVELYLRVTSTVGEESCTIYTKFSPLVNLGTAGEELVWDSWHWEYQGHEWEGVNP